VVAGPGVNTNADQQSRELDRAFLGEALYGSGQGPVVLQGVRVRLPDHPDPDGDGLLTEEELQLGTDPAKPDTDGDGLNDGWEVRYGLNPLLVTAMTEPRGSGRDGFSNLEEQANGTHPRDPASALRLNARLLDRQRCALTWTAVIGHRYVLEYTDSAFVPFSEPRPGSLPAHGALNDRELRGPLSRAGARCAVLSPPARAVSSVSDEAHKQNDAEHAPRTRRVMIRTDEAPRRQRGVDDDDGQTPEEQHPDPAVRFGVLAVPPEGKAVAHDSDAD